LLFYSAFLLEKISGAHAHRSNAEGVQGETKVGNPALNRCITVL